MQNDFISKDFLLSFYFDVARARAYILALQNIVETNNKTALAQISFSALIEALIVTVCRLYDKNSNIGNIYKLFSKDIDNKIIDLKEEYDKLNLNIDKLREFRDKFVAHKDKGYEERYKRLKTCRILEIVEPCVSFAEKVYDKIGDKITRNKNIEDIKCKLSME